VTARPNARYVLGVTAAVLWMAVLLGLYYWVHKPLTPALARAAGGAALDVALAGVTVALAGGAGRRLLRPLDLAPWSVPERRAVEALAGLGALSLAVLAVGVVALRPWSMAILALVLAAVAGREAVAWARELITWARETRPGGGWPGFLAWASAALLLMALIMATLPPAKWDVLTYHLAGPQAYVREGRFYAVADNHFLGFPQLVDTLYAALLALTGRLTAAGPLHWAIGGLALLATGGCAARYGGAAAGWAAVVAVLASRTIWLEMTFAYVDLMLLGLMMAGLLAVERWHAARAAGQAEAGWLALTGAAAGLALGVKYTALWIPLALGLLIAWLGRGDGLRALLRRGMVAGGVAALVFLPWLVRNGLWYDNPLFPFAFEGGGMDSIRQDWYSQPRSGLAYGADAWQVPLMPLLATIFGVENAGTYASDVGPLFALLIPLVPLGWASLKPGARAAAGRMLGAAAVVTLGWMALGALGSYINVQTRLVLYALPPLAVAAGLGLEALRDLPLRPLNLGFVVRAMVGLVVVFTLIDGTRVLITSGIHAYYSGGDDHREQYLEGALGWHYEAMRQVNGLPAGTRVWFLWEPRTLYCDGERVRCRPDSLMDAWYHARRTVPGGSPDAIAERWREAGAEMLLVYEFGRQFELENQGLYDRADWDAWDAFARDHLREVWRGGNADGEVQYILYGWQD